MSNNVIKKATNRWTKGLVMDFSPENTRNEVLTHALNATLLTFNGNELSLQNDQGNARVETAYLPSGYMPVGTCEYGGIIYIVSYNPLENKSQIGCFPSPERNISNNELGIPNIKVLRSHFQKYNADGDPDINGEILHNTQYVLLKNDSLNPGDKFLVCSNKEIYNEKLADLWVDKDSNYYEGSGFIDPEGFELIKNPIIALNIVSIEDDGKIVYLNSDLKQYDVINNYELGGVNMQDTYKYHILGTMAENAGVYDQASVDIDQYRNTLSSGYSVFKSKTSGKLAILAELIMIDSYSVTHSIKPKLDYDKKIIEGAFDIIIHTEVSPELNKDNYYIAPKLQYYYLDNSQGYIEISDSIKSNISTTLFKVENGINTGIPNGNFYNTPMNVIYTAVDEDVKSVIDPGGDKVSPTLGSLGQFNFPLPYTYHGRMSPEEGDVVGDINNLTYTKFTEGQYHRITLDQVSGSLDFYTKEVLAKFYYYDGSGTQYREVQPGEEIQEIYTYYVQEWNHIYYDAQRDPIYQNTDLYKVVSVPQQASETQIVDNTIEKFKKQEIHIYTEATNEDILTEEKLYYTEDGGKTYKQLTEVPQDGVTYYVLEIETHLVSIGYVVSSDTVSGTIYYYPSTKVYELASDSDKEMYYNFDRYPTDCPITLYHRESTPYYVEAGGYQKDNWEDLGIKLFYNTDYILIPRMDLFRDNGFQLFIVVPIDTFVNQERFVPDKTINWINGQNTLYLILLRKIIL